MPEELRCVRVRVRGRVQGVGYRASALDCARALGLGGWVRNLPDGSVELHVEGALRDVDALIAFCREGPTLARVDEVELREAASEGATCFELRR